MSITIQNYTTSETIMSDELEKIVNFRDTKENREFYKKEAKKRGVSLSDFIRTILWKNFEFIPKDYLKISLDDFIFEQLKEKAEADNLSVENYIKKLILKDLNNVKQKHNNTQGPPKRLPPEVKTPKPNNPPKRKPNNPHKLVFMNEMKETIKKGTKDEVFNIKTILNDMEIERKTHNTIIEGILIDQAVERTLLLILIFNKKEVKINHV